MGARQLPEANPSNAVTCVTARSRLRPAVVGPAVKFRECLNSEETGDERARRSGSEPAGAMASVNGDVFCRRLSPRRQRGVALLALIALIAMLGIGLVLEALSTRSQNSAARERISREVLAQAKADLIAWSVSHPTEPGRLPWPDRNADGNYDGQSDCVTSGFNNAHLLGRFPQAGDAAPCDVVPFGDFAADGYGEPLWYAVSRNLLWNRGQSGTDPRLNPGSNSSSAGNTLSSSAPRCATFCPTGLPR